MVFDTLTSTTSQPRPVSFLDHLLSNTSLPKPVRNYLIASKVENKSPRYLETLEDVLKRFFSDHDPMNSSRDDLRFHLLKLSESGLKSSTVHIHFRTLKTFFNWMVAEELLPKNPMASMKPPIVEVPVIQPFSIEDITNMMKITARSKFLDLRNRALILTFLDTGVRLEEMSRIQLDDVCFDDETINIMGKGRKGRLVRIGKTTQKALLRYLVARDDDLPALWLTEERRPLTRDGVKTIIRRITKPATVSGARPSTHTFRHTAAINFLRNGGTEFTLQIMLGHTSLKMTRRYVSALGMDDMIKAHRLASPVDRMKL